METVSERFRSVFGDFWVFNFILPAVIVFRQREDGTSWPKLKIHYIYKATAESQKKQPEKTETEMIKTNDEVSFK